MSGLTTLPLSLLTQVALSAPPQTGKTEKGQELGPVEATPPIEAPPPQIQTGTVVAILEFADGTVATISAEEIEAEIQYSQRLNRTDLIQLRYKILTDKIVALQEGKKVAAFEILDPDMKVLYGLNIFLTKDFDQETIAEFEKQILAFKTPDKPYLIMLSAFLFYQNGKIKIAQVKELVKTALTLAPDQTEIYFNAYRFFATANLFNDAYHYLINGLRTGCGLPLKKDAAPKDALADYASLGSCVPQEMLLEVPALLMLESEYALQNKKPDEALTWIDIAVSIGKKLPFTSEKQKVLFLADLQLKRSKVLMAQEEYMDAYEALESAVKVYEEAAEENPENSGLQLRLASIFLALVQVNKFLPGHQQYLRYHLGRCLTAMKTALESAEKAKDADEKILFDVSQLYISISEAKEAIRIVEKLKGLDPKNIQYLMQLGDLYLSGGEIEKAFQNYQAALSNAPEDSMVIAGIHLRFAHIHTQAEITLVKIKAGQPNVAQALLNFGTTALISYFNPSYLLSLTIGKLTGAIFNKELSQKDWETIMEKAALLESRSFERISDLARLQNRPEAFFFIAEAVFAQSTSLIKQAEEIEEKSIANPEEVEGIKEIAAALRDLATSIIDSVFKKSFIKKLGRDFEKAKAAKNPEEMLKIASLYFDLFMLITKKLADKSVSPEFARRLEKIRSLLLDEGKKRIEEIRSYAEEALDLPLGMELFHFTAKIMGALPKKDALQEEVFKILATNIKIAKEKGDLDSLMEFGKAIRFFGPLSYKAWQDSLEVAGDNRDKLVQIGGALVAMWEAEASSDLVQEMGDKEALKKLAVTTYQKIRDLSTGDERLSACRQLWLLGAYEDAYLGYVSTIDEFKAQKNPDQLANLFFELALMSEVRGKHDKALEWISRAIATGSHKLQDQLKQEQQILQRGKLPDYILLKSDSHFTELQIHSALFLAIAWSNGAASSSYLERAIENLYLAGNLWADASVASDGTFLEIEIKEEKIDAIKIAVVKGGKQRTKTEVILRELGYAGLASGDLLSADLSTLSGKISEASNRLKTFIVKDFRFEEKDGQRTLVVEIDEPYSGAVLIRGGGGSDQVLFGLGAQYNNLLGGGEKIGGMITTHFFFPSGHDFMYNIGGKVFYEDPHLFVLAEDHPVSGRFEAERTSRVNYIDGTLETIMGGSVTLGVKIAPKTTLMISPAFYYTKPSSNRYEVFQPSLKVALEHDGRDNWLIPKSGYYFLTSVTGGAYFGSASNAQGEREKFSQFFLMNINEGRYYIQLPVGIVLAFRGVAGFGYNLFGGDVFNTAGPLNPYVRASSNPYATGPGILAGSMELRAPVIEIPESKGTKMQFYGFGDAGYIFKGGFTYGVGGGVRMYIPLLGIVNIGGGWPGGFFIWFGDLGWN